MHDVLAQIVLGGGDEPLHTLQMPRAIRLLDRLGPARADIGSGVGLGEHHRRRPAIVDHDLGPAPLLSGAVQVHHMGHAGPAHVDERRRVRPQHQLRDSPAQGGRRAVATQIGGQIDAVPLTVPERPVGLLECLRQHHAVGFRIEFRWVAVGLGEGLRQRSASQPIDLGEHVVRGLAIHLGERAGTHPLLHPQYLEQHELEVAEIALVVAHVLAPAQSRYPGLLTGNLTILPTSNTGNSGIPRRDRIHIDLAPVAPVTATVVRTGCCSPGGRRRRPRRWGRRGWWCCPAPGSRWTPGLSVSRA